MNPNFTLFIIIVFILLLFGVYIRFFLRRHNGFMQFVKVIMLPLTVLGGWVVYFTGYMLGSEAEPTVHSVVMYGLQALFSAGRLFVLGNDLVEISEHVKENPNFLLWFSLVGTMAVFLSISILFNVFGKRLITRIRIWLRLSRENHVFFGVNEASVTLARDLLLRDRNRLVVFITKLDRNEDTNLYHAMEETGALVVENESFLESLTLKQEESLIHIRHGHAGPLILNKLKLIRKIHKCPSHLYFLSDTEAWNINMARTILDEMSTKALHHPVIFHVSIHGSDLEELFYQSLPEPARNIHVRLLNYSEIATRQLIARHNPVDWILKDTQKGVAMEDFRVMIVGFDQTGSAALRKLTEFGQFPGSRFKAIITDKCMEVKKGRFANSFPGLVSHYDISFLETEAGSSNFFDVIRQQMDHLDYIVIALGNDALNMQTAVDIRQMALRSPGVRMKILALVKSNDHYRYQTGDDDRVSIHAFGRTSHIFTEDIVVRGKLEDMAVQIHAYYNSLKPAEKHRTWDELTRMERAGNISAAGHIRVKLALAGLQPQDILQLENTDAFEAFLGKERMENLARGEHLHWNAMLFSHGWERWNLSEIPADASSNKDNLRRLHACLVDWDELAAVGERFNENYYQYDYENIHNIFPLVKEGVFT
ncbi:MAG TPA: hypothetical protein P5228_05425 [Bacteroidales bacterium]|nr:hypothetical protein [Bacteroidales bacterium]HRZ47787.1 hypothetical protein [Bacteroidales bacterium]